jgi:hypothetical protein
MPGCTPLRLADRHCFPAGYQRPEMEKARWAGVSAGPFHCCGTRGAAPQAAYQNERVVGGRSVRRDGDF